MDPKRFSMLVPRSLSSSDKLLGTSFAAAGSATASPSAFMRSRAVPARRCGGPAVCRPDQGETRRAPIVELHLSDVDSAATIRQAVNCPQARFRERVADRDSGQAAGDVDVDRDNSRLDEKPPIFVLVRPVIVLTENSS